MSDPYLNGKCIYSFDGSYNQLDSSSANIQGALLRLSKSLACLNSALPDLMITSQVSNVGTTEFYDYRDNCNEIKVQLTDVSAAHDNTLVFTPIDSTDHTDIKNFEDQVELLLENRTESFIYSVVETDFEDNRITVLADEIRLYIDNYSRFVTYSWLCKLYSTNQKKSIFIAHFLRLLAQSTDKTDAPYLIPIAKSCLNDKDVCVQEAAIMVFEEWRSKDCLDALETTRYSSSWIKEYAEKVIAELKNELKVC